MNDKLQKIIENKKFEVENTKKFFYDNYSKLNISEIKKIKKNNKKFKQSLQKSGLSIIAEIKRRSPAKGELAEITQPEKLAAHYLLGGADAISVLTDKKFFNGSIKDLITIKKRYAGNDFSILRKDFIIDEIQILESILIGADAILLIAAVLKDRLELMYQTAKEYQVDAIVEIHNKNELDQAIAIGAEIIGINNRNLTTFETNLSVSKELIHSVPEHVIKISESGISSPEHTKELHQLGFDAVLIGEALVKSKNPIELIQTLKRV